MTDTHEYVDIDIEYPDGTIARWSLDDDDPRIEQVENLLGTPDTMFL